MGASDIWTIRSTLEWMEGYLARHDDPNPRLSAQMLMGEACDMSRVELFMNFDRPLSNDERACLREWVTRRGQGEPLQYITGTAPFRHLSLIAKPGVLIPRPETEVLVSEVLAHLPKKQKIRSAEYMQEMQGLSAFSVDGEEEEESADIAVDEVSLDTAAFSDELLIADLCTGSGCIACALVTEHDNIKVIATDISPEAIELAAENIVRLGIEDEVQLIRCDLGSGIPADAMGTFDCVVSNPPYVPSSVCDDLDLEVKDFEPRLALDGGKDGLDLFKKISKWAYAALKEDGFLAVELFEATLDEARDIARADGFNEVKIIKDLAGKDRCLICWKGCRAHE